MRLLAGDIGGTKTLLALAEPQRTGLRWLRSAHYSSADYPDLESLLREFLGPDDAPARACLAVAGPIESSPGGTRARITNLPWTLDAGALGHAIGAPVQLINDFVGVAHGIAHLPAEALATLQTGVAESAGMRAVLGAGTGLGMAMLAPENAGWRVLPSEGGHVDFAPQGALQEGFAGWLRGQHPHLSVERVLSGPGIEALYAYLTALRPELGAPIAPAGAPEISAAAARGDARALLALDEFTRIYGAQAGNLALLALPFGGLYLAGGIAPAHAGRLRSGPFMEAFLAKGRFRGLLARVPVHIILDPQVGLLGAAMLAAAPAIRRP
ncbi:MAG: glucokinase [Panacagrimonas sp.]